MCLLMTFQTKATPSPGPGGDCSIHRFRRYHFLPLRGPCPSARPRSPGRGHQSQFLLVCLTCIPEPPIGPAKKNYMLFFDTKDIFMCIYAHTELYAFSSVRYFPHHVSRFPPTDVAAAEHGFTNAQVGYLTSALKLDADWTVAWGAVSQKSTAV